MKIKHNIPIALAIAAALSTVGCSKEEDQVSEDSLKLGIIGKWKYCKCGDTTIPTDEQGVCTYHVDGTYETSWYGKDVWMPKQIMNYAVVGNTVVMESKEYDVFLKKTVSSITKDRLVFNYSESSYDRKEVGTTYEYARVTKNFSDAIVGFWKGESMDGQQTFGDENHMWEYAADGSYSYYTKAANGKWLPLDQDNRYACDGDLLVCRWKSNDTTNIEQWNVESCDSQKMSWTAMRKAEDGSTFETNFQFKRISDKDGSVMSPGFIRSKLPGSWKCVSFYDKTLATNDRGSYTFLPDGTGNYTSTLCDAWDPAVALTYILTRNNIGIKYYDASIKTTKIMKVISIDDDSLYVKSTVDSESLTEFDPSEAFSQIYKRIKDDFSFTIVGLWEGVSISGEDGYDVTEHRWKFNLDGTYYFYNKEGDKWVISEEETSDYIVTGDWIGCRWRKDGKSEMNYERWDIDSCDSQSMNWSAVRERKDGTQYSANITFKRVVSQ